MHTSFFSSTWDRLFGVKTERDYTCHIPRSVHSCPTQQLWALNIEKSTYPLILLSSRALGNHHWPSRIWITCAFSAYLDLAGNASLAQTTNIRKYVSQYKVRNTTQLHSHRVWQGNTKKHRSVNQLLVLAHWQLWLCCKSLDMMWAFRGVTKELTIAKGQTTERSKSAGWICHVILEVNTFMLKMEKILMLHTQFVLNLIYSCLNKCPI